MSSVPFRVKALFEYVSEHDDDLNFGEGQVITVTEEEDDDWYYGEYSEALGAKKQGLFPRNFVEKFEPTAPPRPTRRTKQDSMEPSVFSAQTEYAQADPIETPSSPVVAPTFTAPPVIPTSAPVPPAPVVAPEPEIEPEVAKEEHMPVPPILQAAPAPVVPIPAPTPAVAPIATSAPAPAPVLLTPQPFKAPEAPAVKPAAPAPAPASKPPPPVVGKPSNNAFLQRIAAFNKGGGGPVVPVKPSSANAYIKKPFVAAPPSRDAYVPPVRNDFVPTKIYRREEDPEVKEQEAEIREVASKAGLLVEQNNEQDGDDQPKPMSLKERMALLQKQQMEAAQRHADIVAKKEKPKKPLKKRTESSEAPSAVDSAIVNDNEGSAKPSMDEARPPPVPMSPGRRRVSKSNLETSDGNEADLSGAGDTTEGGEDFAERNDVETAIEKKSIGAEQQEEGQEEEEEEEEEDDVDPEVRRKEELRARMAKISGGMGMPGMGMGMGMAGMFGGGMMGMGGAPPIRKKKPTAPKERQSIDEQRDDEATSAPSGAPAVPMPIPGMMALPGMSQKKRPEEKEHEPEGDEESEMTPASAPQVPMSPPRPTRSRESRSEDNEVPAMSPRPIPRAIPSSPTHTPRASLEARPVPPPSSLAAPADILSPSPGSASDDEETDAMATGPATPAGRSPPPLPPIGASPNSGASRVPPLPPITAPFTTDEVVEPPSSPQSKRLSRPPPPIPGVAPALPSTQTRAPPPPPPTDAPSIPGRNENEEEEEEVTEYDGDYDTDIASSAPHRDALNRESNADSIPGAPPPLPPTAAPKAIPPRLSSSPSSAPVSETRHSIDAPRAAPPLPPSAVSHVQQHNDVSHRNQRTSFSYGNRQTPAEPMIEEDGVFDPHTQISTPPPRAAPTAATPSRSAKQSFDGSRVVRRSIDIGRQSMSVETGYIANDVDLALYTQWYAVDNQVPPVFQGRKDILFESEQDTCTNGGSKTVVTRTIYVLFQDYSQSIITIKYDPYNAVDVEAEQRHELPPRTPRQDQLEDSHERYGKAIADAAASRKDTVVADGTSQGFVLELLRPFNDLLAPIGTRSYGTQVYSSLGAGAPVVDQIRPGDIISCRSARFQGKHGPMHAKYSMEVGKNDYHVAIVAEWDGLKKKVRAWEQGRESKKVKMESFKLDDLRSGEVKVFRVMPRTWVGWSGAK